MTLVEWRIKWESGVFVWHDVCIQEFSVFRFGGGEGGRAPTKSDLNLVQLTLSRKRSTPRSLAPSLSSDANVSKGSNYSRPALNDLWDHLYIGFGLVRNVQFNNATVKTYLRAACQLLDTFWDDSIDTGCDGVDQSDMIWSWRYFQTKSRNAITCCRGTCSLNCVAPSAWRSSCSLRM